MSLGEEMKWMVYSPSNRGNPQRYVSAVSVCPDKQPEGVVLLPTLPSDTGPQKQRA